MRPHNPRLDGLQPSRIRTYTALAAQTPGCISLALGEPAEPTPEPVIQAAEAALQAGKTHYAPNRGIPELVEAIAGIEGRRSGEVIVTAGASEALYLALTGICSPGDEVIVPVPAFPLYESILTAAGAVLVPLALQAGQIDPAALETAITPKTRAIVLNSPNNPTGTVLGEASLAAVKQAALGKSLYLVCDQVYDRLTSGSCPSLCRDPELREQILLCQSFSKPWAMTGWRAGYLIGPEDLMEKLLLLHAAMLASVPTFVQWACLTALELDPEPMRQSCCRRQAYVFHRLEAMGLTCPRPEGAFYVFPDVSRFGLEDGELCRRMIETAGVAAVPGSCFRGDGSIRLSCACSMETLETAMDRMEAFFDAL